MVSITVFGKPQPRGSKTPYVNKATGRAGLYDDNKKSKPWMAAISAAAGDAMFGCEVLSGPVVVTVAFHFARLQKHYGTKRGEKYLRGDAPDAHETRPDPDKLLRAVLDALSGIVFRDDRQVAGAACIKCYTNDCERCEIEVRQIKRKLAVPASAASLMTAFEDALVDRFTPETTGPMWG